MPAIFPPDKCLLDVNYDFGNIKYYDTYVIGLINDNVKVTTAIAKEILNDLEGYYRGTSIIYISNRAFQNDIDLKVYKLVSPKLIKGIAVVGNSNKHKVQALGEQSLYNGAFTYFLTIADAVSWAHSFSK
jgi:hypothetical protein